MICLGCGCVFCWDEADERGPRLYCSKACRRRCSDRHHTRVRRRRRPGEPSTYDGVRDEAIYERDGWMCQMPVCTCPDGRGIDPALASPHKWCASIDHIIPVTEGGTDSADNKRAAHTRCNVKDQARRAAAAEKVPHGTG